MIAYPSDSFNVLEAGIGGHERCSSTRWTTGRLQVKYIEGIASKSNPNMITLSCSR